jgi:hypothetical protein
MSETDTLKEKSSSPCEADPKGLLTESRTSEILRESQAVERGNHPRDRGVVGPLPHALQRRPWALADSLELPHKCLPLLIPLGPLLRPLGRILRHCHVANLGASPDATSSSANRE